MEKDYNEIHRIERLTQEYFNHDDIRSGLKVYRSLMDMCPREETYYLNYIGFLLDERAIVELLWSAYEEAIACCNRALGNVVEEDKLYFYIKKAEVYISMIDGDYKWYTDNKAEVNNFIEEALAAYPEHIAVLKCVMAIFRMTGNVSKYEEILDIAVKHSPNDFFLIIQQVVSLQEKGNREISISLLEKWIKDNPESSHLNAAYNRIIILFKSVGKEDMADVYQDLLDNL